jgi:hypothetical protein
MIKLAAFFLELVVVYSGIGRTNHDELLSKRRVGALRAAPGQQ